MKRMYSKDAMMIGIIGETDDIKRIYSSIYRAYMKGRFDNIYPSYFMLDDGRPAKYAFSKRKVYYMLSIDEEGIVTVHDSDVITGFIMDGAKIA